MTSGMNPTTIVPRKVAPDAQIPNAVVLGTNGPRLHAAFRKLSRYLRMASSNEVNLVDKLVGGQSLTSPKCRDIVTV